MSAAFEKFEVRERGLAEMWLVPVWVKLRGRPRNPDWFAKEMAKLSDARNFIEAAIREKLERERP